MYSECGKYLLPSQRVECVREDICGGIEETKVYDEAWMFGKVLWVTMLQIALGIKFSSKGVARGYQCCYNLVKHSPLCRKGSYFSRPVNGHV